MRQTNLTNKNTPRDGFPPQPDRSPASRERAVTIAVLSVSAVFFIVLGFLLFRNLFPSVKLFSASSAADEPPHVTESEPEPAAESGNGSEAEITIESPTAEPSVSGPSAPEPPVSPEPVEVTPTPPTEGISNAGTRIRNVIYTPSGQVESLDELIDGEWVHWSYVYDRLGSFRYRFRNIGTVESKLGSKVIPGTDTTYSDTSEYVYNCVGFTLEYAVTEVYAGGGLGERTLCFLSNGSWIEELVFDYPRYETLYYTFSFDRPISFSAFGTPRIHPDNSMFMTHQVLTQVLIADYAYVCPDGVS